MQWVNFTGKVKSQSKVDSSMKLEQESPIIDLKCVEETTSDNEVWICSSRLRSNQQSSFFVGRDNEVTAKARTMGIYDKFMAIADTNDNLLDDIKSLRIWSKQGRWGKEWYRFCCKRNQRYSMYYEQGPIFGKRQLIYMISGDKFA